MSARESMTFWAEMWGVAPGEVESRVHDLLERFDLGERADDRVGGFSRGMRQRLALARTLVHDPPLLFLDEPTAALDPIAAIGVRDLVRAQAADRRRTVLICTHNLAEAQELCDRVVILRNGRVVADGSPAEVAGAASLPVSVRIEVDADHAADALRIVSAHPGARATLDGAGELEVEGITRESVPGLVGELVAAGASVYRINPQQPTLEDAYVALYGGADERIPGDTT
jgi:ABC-2 type transport system ATP-binding protein